MVLVRRKWVGLLAVALVVAVGLGYASYRTQRIHAEHYRSELFAQFDVDVIQAYAEVNFKPSAREYAAAAVYTAGAANALQASVQYSDMQNPNAPLATLQNKLANFFGFASLSLIGQSPVYNMADEGEPNVGFTRSQARAFIIRVNRVLNHDTESNIAIEPNHAPAVFRQIYRLIPANIRATQSQTPIMELSTVDGG